MAVITNPAQLAVIERLREHANGWLRVLWDGHDDYEQARIMAKLDAYDEAIEIVENIDFEAEMARAKEGGDG